MSPITNEQTLVPGKHKHSFWEVQRSRRGHLTASQRTAIYNTINNILQYNIGHIEVGLSHIMLQGGSKVES